MRGAEGLRRFLYLCPLFAAALFAQALRAGTTGPGLAFAAIVSYARIAALIAGASGIKEALLFAEALPALAFCIARLAEVGDAAALVAVSEAAALIAALLLVEASAKAERNPLAAASLFVVAAMAGGLALERAQPIAVLGGSAALGLAAGYILARRQR